MAKFYITDGGKWNTMTKAEHEMREKIMAIIAQHTSTFYAGYGYSSEDGVKEDDYDEVADSIMEAFTMTEKK
jgi:hypothetical protein